LALYTAAMGKRSDSKPNPGDTVVLVRIPAGLLNDLPIEDQEAIRDAVGKPVRLNDYDSDGRAELEFEDRNGTIHYVYVEPGCIRKS
jgi:hypothetical protein